MTGPATRWCSPRSEAWWSPWRSASGRYLRFFSPPPCFPFSIGRCAGATIAPGSFSSFDGASRSSSRFSRRSFPPRPARGCASLLCPKRCGCGRIVDPRRPGTAARGHRIPTLGDARLSRGFGDERGARSVLSSLERALGSGRFRSALRVPPRPQPDSDRARRAPGLAAQRCSSPAPSFSFRASVFVFERFFHVEKRMEDWQRLRRYMYTGAGFLRVEHVAPLRRGGRLALAPREVDGPLTRRSARSNAGIETRSRKGAPAAPLFTLDPRAGLP